MQDQVQRICRLEDNNIETLRDTFSIVNLSNLALLAKADIDTILGTETATFLK